jgi:signal transduction histidine kinase/CheY-like chemotaxis protein
MVTDITPLKLATRQIELAEAYHKSEQERVEHQELSGRLDFAAHAAQLGIWEWRLKSNELIWNEQMYLLCRSNRIKIERSQDKFNKALHPDDKNRFWQEIRTSLRAKTPFRSKYRVIWPSGEIRILKSQGEWHFDKQGTPKSLIGVSYDVTERENTERELLEAREVAISASHAKTEFLSTMSHEIRTPMNGVIGMTNLLMETRLDAEQKEYAETIFQSGKTLLTLINDILDFSKIEAGKMELEAVEFDLQDYIKDLVKPFQYTSSKKGIALELSITPYPQLIWGDDGRIGQIISNLISNSIKFTQVGGVTVSLSCTPIHEKTHVTLAVHDTGVGIPDAAKARIFEAFAQAESSTSRHFGGTGLGLSISKRLVDLMRGRIGFESAQSKGTTFTVELDLRTGRPKTIQSPIQIPSSHPRPQIGGRVLVAEDNPTNQMVIGRMLEKWGCKYHVVANGNEALAALRETEFDLILMDCQMPEMDGYEATRTIRRMDGSQPNLPIIALTANVVQSEQEKCRAAGMVDYVSKPIDQRTLEGVLRRWIVKDSSCIDRNILKQFDSLQIKGKPDILVQAIESFLKTSPKRIQAISKLVQERDIEKVAREAHGLKSSAQTLGALALGEICQKLEDIPKSVPPTELDSLFETLKNSFRQSCKELTEIKTQQERNP